MSGTPIYEQLCRDYVDAGKAWPGDVAPPAVASQLTELDEHLPLALAELTCPGD